MAFDCAAYAQTCSGVDGYSAYSSCASTVTNNGVNGMACRIQHLALAMKSSEAATLHCPHAAPMAAAPCNTEMLRGFDCAEYVSICSGVAGYSAYSNCASTVTANGANGMACRTEHLTLAVITRSSGGDATHCPHAAETATGPCAAEKLATAGGATTTGAAGATTTAFALPATTTTAGATAAAGATTTTTAGATATAGATTTAGASDVKIVTELTVTYLDYDKVNGNATAKAALITDITDAFLAQHSGYVAADVEVTLSKGSVKAKVAVTPKSGDAAALKASMTSTKDAIAAAVLTVVKTMVAADPTLLEAGKTPADLAVTATAPVETLSPPSTTATPGGDATSGSHQTVCWGLISIITAAFTMSL